MIDTQVSAHFDLLNGWRLLRLAGLGPRVTPGERVRLAGRDLIASRFVEDSIELMYRDDPDWRALRVDQPLAVDVVGEAFDTVTSWPAELHLLVQEHNIGALHALCHSALNERVAGALILTRSGLPFRIQPSRFLFDGLPPHAIAADPLCERHGLPTRIIDDGQHPACADRTTAMDAEALRDCLTSTILPVGELLGDGQLTLLTEEQREQWLVS